MKCLSHNQRVEWTRTLVHWLVQVKSKNNPSKKRRNAKKKKLNESGSVTNEVYETNPSTSTSQEKEPCNKFILVDEYSMTFTPLNIQFNNPPSGEPPNTAIEICQLNTVLALPSTKYDQYKVINSKDEVDNDIFPAIEHDDDDDETSKHLIRAFSPKEIKQLNQEQGLSPRDTNP